MMEGILAGAGKNLNSLPDEFPERDMHCSGSKHGWKIGTKRFQKLLTEKDRDGFPVVTSQDWINELYSIHSGDIRSTASPNSSHDNISGLYFWVRNKPDILPRPN
jgi:hypothetical protein